MMTNYSHGSAPSGIPIPRLWAAGQKPPKPGPYQTPKPPSYGPKPPAYGPKPPKLPAYGPKPKPKSS